MYQIILNDKEEKRYKKFCEKHKICRINAGKDTVSGFPVGHTELIITPTGIGDVIEVRCPICGKKKNITDYDSW